MRWQSAVVITFSGSIYASKPYASISSSFSAQMIYEFDRGLVELATLPAAVGEVSETIGDVYEPYLRADARPSVSRRLAALHAVDRKRIRSDGSQSSTARAVQFLDRPAKRL